jgi:peptide/nickel transport system substrate-binding protein
MLRTMVAAGELPPVEERLPEEPAVMEPAKEIGQYGGTLRVLALDVWAWNDMGEVATRGETLLRVAEDGVTLEGDLAKGYKLSDDGKTFTLYLREGAKWSDGAPFTVDDLLFAFYDMHWNPQVPYTIGFLTSALTEVKKIDDYTVRFEMSSPCPVMAYQLVMSGGHKYFKPKHYLKRWHIDYNPEAEELAKEEGYENWWKCLMYHASYSAFDESGINMPTLQPWIVETITTTNKLHVRNPYYWKVDTAGNQLPYIDKIMQTVVGIEVYQMKVISGEADVAYFQTSVENYPLYKENEEAGGYTVGLIPGVYGANIFFAVNVNNPNPVKRDLYRDVRFRRALSLAINREELNEVCYFGLGTPRQATVLPSCSYYKKEWGEAYAQYEPDTANRILDEIGLTERDQEGFRLGPDGKPFLLTLEYVPGSELIFSSAFIELTKEYWQKAGLKVGIKPMDGSLFWERVDAQEIDVIPWALDTSLELTNYMVGPCYWTGGDNYYAGAWQKWLDAKEAIERGTSTLSDYEGKLPGEEPPEEIKQVYKWAKMREQTRLGSKEYVDLSQKIFDFFAEEVYMIGTVGMLPRVFIANKNIGNIPENYPPGKATYVGELNYYGQQLFFR